MGRSAWGSLMPGEELTASERALETPASRQIQTGHLSFPFVSRMEIALYEGMCAHSGVGGDEGILKKKRIKKGIEEVLLLKAYVLIYYCF